MLFRAVLAALWVLCACGAAHAQDTSDEVASFPADALYLDSSSATTYGEADMPLRVAIGKPDDGAKDASHEETRRAVISGFRAWEIAIQRLFPWFQLEIVDKDEDAPIQAEWKKRPRGYLPARGSMEVERKGDTTRLRSHILLSPQPVPSAAFLVSAGALRVYAMHAFGSALGLPDCWECDSIMSMGWGRQEDPSVTDLDVRSYEALVKRSAAEPDVALEAPKQEAGVLADLPILNTGDGRSIVVDIASEGQRSFVVTLDTGATDTVLTRDYARAIGVSVRRIKQDAYRRDTATGQQVRFWVANQKSSAMEYALLGGEFMQQYVVDIDFERRRVRFLDPETHAVGDLPNELVVPLQINERRPYAELALGTGSLWALVDTGAQAPLIVTEERARGLGIEPDPEGERLLYYNVMGTSTDLAQTVPSARLGPVALSEVTLHISLRDESSARVTRWLQHEAIVGFDILRDYRVRFDYPRARMGLVPHDRKKTEDGELPIVDDVSAELTKAMRARDSVRTNALRGIRAAFLHEMKKDGADSIPDETCVTLLRRLEKQRRESIEAFEQAGRDERVAAEKAELMVIAEFLPQLADEAQTRAWVEAAIAETGAETPGDVGKVMGALMKAHKGDVDGTLARQIAQLLLAG